MKNRICIGLTLILMIACCSCEWLQQEELVFVPEEYDDAAVDPSEVGKIANLAVQYDDWIYYRSNNDKIYRIRLYHT